MIDSIGSIGASSGASPVAAASGVSSQAASSSGVGGGSSLHNPRVVLDPTVGFITEYLSANGGSVVSQSPSAITVAYLRQGLLPDGTPSQAEASYTTVA